MKYVQVLAINFIFILCLCNFANTDRKSTEMGLTAGFELEFQPGPNKTMSLIDGEIPEILKGRDVSDENADDDPLKDGKLKANTKRHPYLHPIAGRDMVNIEVGSRIYGDKKARKNWKNRQQFGEKAPKKEDQQELFKIEEMTKHMRALKREIYRENVGLGFLKKGSNSRFAYPASFHVHTRHGLSQLAPSESSTPEEALQRHNEIYSRMGDAIYMWRVRVFDPDFYRGNYTQGRNSPYSMHYRGTLRAVADNHPSVREQFRGNGHRYDAEFRGFGTDISSLEKMLTIQREYLQNPKKIKISPHHQYLRHLPNPDIAHSLETTLGKENISLSKKEKAWAQKFASVAVNHRSFFFGYGHSEQEIFSNLHAALPFMGFEFDPHLTQRQRDKVKKANKAFMKKFYQLIKSYSQMAIPLSTVKKEEGKVVLPRFYLDKNPKFAHLINQFHQLIRNWMKSSRLDESILRSLSFTQMEGLAEREKKLGTDLNYLRYLLHTYKLSSDSQELNDFIRYKAISRDHVRALLKDVPQRFLEENICKLNLSEIKRLLAVRKDLDIRRCHIEKLAPEVRKLLEEKLEPHPQTKTCPETDEQGQCKKSFKEKFKRLVTFPFRKSYLFLKDRYKKRRDPTYHTRFSKSSLTDKVLNMNFQLKRFKKK